MTFPSPSAPSVVLAMLLSLKLFHRLTQTGELSKQFFRNRIKFEIRCFYFISLAFTKEYLLLLLKAICLCLFLESWPCLFFYVHRLPRLQYLWLCLYNSLVVPLHYTLKYAFLHHLIITYVLENLLILTQKSYIRY